jgi:mycothiol system anti-sigma-R factor
VTNQPGASPSPEGDEADCSEALHELYTFLDGELTVERRTHISRHLDDCGGCLEAFDFEAELRIVVSQKCRDEVPESLRRRVAQALGGGEQQQAE